MSDTEHLSPFDARRARQLARRDDKFSKFDRDHRGRSQDQKQIEHAQKVETGKADKLAFEQSLANPPTPTPPAINSRLRKFIH